ncbi:ribonuclease III [Lanmaoa asiatica]|nr:ribonuclease III [Lanmaoa asiatica]
MAIKYVLALRSISLRTTTVLISTRIRSRSLSHLPLWNIDYTVSHWCPDLTSMPSSPPPVLCPTFTDDNPLPPLPPIHDNYIRTKVFTHRSFYARPNHVFEDHPDDPSPDNEKFEHLGDTVLGLIVTGLLLNMYPGLRVGPATVRAIFPNWHRPYPSFTVQKVRALIVGNTTLAAISRRYKLPAQLRLHPAQAITLRASVNIQGMSTLCHPITSLTCPPQPTSLKSVLYTSFFGTRTDHLSLPPLMDSHTWVGCISTRVSPQPRNGSRHFLNPYTTEAYICVRTEHGLPPLPAPVSPPLAPSTSVSSTSSASSSSSDTTSSPPSPEGSRKSTSITSTPAHRNPHHHPHASGTPTTTGHLALFHQQLQKTRREVEWVYDDAVAEGTTTTPIWVVRVEVDGEVFGRGKGGTKKAARNEAAKEGLVRMGIVV